MSLQYEQHAAEVAARDPEHLLVAMDSSDGLVQARNEAEVVAAYWQVVSTTNQRQPRLVLALETGCIAGFCVRIPSLPSPALPGNIHVNGGFVMGPARLMQRLWHEVAYTNVSCCHKGRMHPQLGMGTFALRHPELVAFDVHQHLAAVINLHDNTEWPSNYKADRGIVSNKHTGVRPAFLHFPGQQFPSSWHAYRDQILGPRGLLSSHHAAGFIPHVVQGAQGQGQPHVRILAKKAQALLPRLSPAWPVVRASACNGPHERVAFLLTSTPPRAPRLGRILENMRSQSRKPDVVVLTIPHAYSRKPLASMHFEPPATVAGDPLLQVCAHLYRLCQPCRFPKSPYTLGGSCFTTDCACQSRFWAPHEILWRCCARQRE